MTGVALDATAIGEGQLRLGTSAGRSLQRAESLTVTVAGTEGNVMGMLAQLGNRTGLVTALPTGPLGRMVADEYRAAGIDTSAFIWRDAGRIALYFVERSAPPVPDRVIYDRENSCFWNLTINDIDWEYVGSSRLVHLTGITACLNDELHSVALKAAKSAKANGQSVSIDVNYRVALASPELARERLEPLMRAADVIACSKRDAKIVFGIDGETTNVVRQLCETYGSRTALVSDGAGPVVVAAGADTLSLEPPTTTVVDRVGAGDALVAGFLHGYLHGDPKLGLELGVAAAALTLTRFGDQVRTNLNELLQLGSNFGADIVR